MIKRAAARQVSRSDYLTQYGIHLLETSNRFLILFAMVTRGFFANWCSIAAALPLLSNSACAAQVEIGAPAPPVAIRQWIAGGPVDTQLGRGTNLLALVFWDTQSQPSREALPGVSEIQKRFKDRGVTIVALTDELPSVVRTFVSNHASQINYAIGIDEKNKLFETFMTPFEQTGVPYAFLVDTNGWLVWHGHPLGSMDRALEELLSGKFNLEGAKKRDQWRKLQQQYASIVNDPKMQEAAAEIGERLLKEAAREPVVLNQFAWRILMDRNIRYRDAALALRAAKAAFEASGGKNGAVLDTYANALFENGNKEEAIKIQRAAIPLARDMGQRLEFEASLNRYQRLARENSR